MVVTCIRLGGIAPESPLTLGNERPLIGMPSALYSHQPREWEEESKVRRLYVSEEKSIRERYIRVAAMANTIRAGI
jgi:hypothetical protein